MPTGVHNSPRGSPEAATAAVRGKSMTQIRAKAHERHEKVRLLLKKGFTRPEVCFELQISRSQLDTSVRWLIRQRKIQRSTIVMATGPNTHVPAPRQRTSVYAAKRAALLAEVRHRGVEHYLEISDRMGVPRSTAYGWLGEEGLRPAELRLRLVQSPENQAKERRYLALVADGMPKKRAALEVGVSESTASRWARKHGLVGEVRGATPKNDVPPAPIPYEKLSEQARAALEDPALFARTYLELELGPWARDAMLTLLELYHSGDDEFVNLNAPPGVGKSTAVTYAFVAWFVTRERAMGLEPTISLGHDVWTKATWYVKRLRTTFTHNAKLIRDFGRFRPESRIAAWSVEELLIEPLNWQLLREKEPTISAASYDAGVLSGRYKLIIWDDLVSKRNSRLPEAREMLKDWWQQEAETRLNAGGLLVLSNARYGPEDLSATVMEDVDEDDLDEAGEARPIYRKLAYRAHYEELCPSTEHVGPWPNGCLLDPKFAPYKRIHREQIKNEGRFRLVWQQEDSDPVGFLAQKAWFEGGQDRLGVLRVGCFDRERRFGQNPRPDETPGVSAVTVDPSSAHWWGIEHWVAYPDGIQYLVQGLRAALKAPELLYIGPNGVGWQGVLEDYWAASLAAGVPFTYVIVEKNAQQKWLTQYPFVNEWSMARQVAIVPHETNWNKGDEDLGVEMLRPLYEFGRARLPYAGHLEQVFADQFRKEACSWPEGRTNDLIVSHWFLNHRIAPLMAASGVYDTGGGGNPAAPGWATHGVPSWASARLGRDSGASIPA